MKLDLGSGPKPAEGFLGVDRLHVDGVVYVDLTNGMPWPFEDESVEELRASHFIEHIRTDPFAGRDRLFMFFEEAWRVAKLGARFELRWPAAFHPVTGLMMESAFWDPTHYRIIPPRQIAFYLSRESRQTLGVGHYDVRCNWVLTRDVEWRTLNASFDVIELVAELRKEPL